MQEAKPNAAHPNVLTDPARLPVPGARAAGIVASLAAISCLLPWFVIDLAAVGDAMRPALKGATEAGPPGMGEMFRGMMSSMNLSGSVTANGIDGWLGIGALLASIAVAVLTFAEPSGALPWQQHSVLMANVVLSFAAGSLVVYALSNLGGPLSIEYGLVFAALSTVGAAVFAFRRLLAHGWLQQTGPQL